MMMPPKRHAAMSPGFSLSEIKDFLHSLEGSGGMQRVRAVFEDKLRETRQNLDRLQRLEEELRASLEYLGSCRWCGNGGPPPPTCTWCDQTKGSGPPPDLVAGLTDGQGTGSSAGATGGGGGDGRGSGRDVTTQPGLRLLLLPSLTATFVLLLRASPLA